LIALLVSSYQILIDQLTIAKNQAGDPAQYNFSGFCELVSKNLPVKKGSPSFFWNKNP
jgi:hypothetical protein